MNLHPWSLENMETLLSEMTYPEITLQMSKRWVRKLVKWYHFFASPNCDPVMWYCYTVVYPCDSWTNSCYPWLVAHSDLCSRCNWCNWRPRRTWDAHCTSCIRSQHQPSNRSKLSFIFFCTGIPFGPVINKCCMHLWQKNYPVFQTTTVQYGLRYWLLTLQVARTGGK